MFTPDDPLAPPQKVFDEPWQAQALALADTLVQQGHVAATDWAEALGKALRDADAAGAPDTLDTYYQSVITALEAVIKSHTEISQVMMDQRRDDWKDAYLRTPHGQPIRL